MLRKNKGFTLIELLIVIAIIAVLASIALLSLAPAQKAGRDARRVSDLRQMQSILQLYYNHCGFYPGPGAAPGAPCIGVNEIPVSGNFVDIGTWSWDLTNGLADVLAESGLIPSAAQIPQDPLKGSRTYLYGRNFEGTSYVMQAVLETDNSVLNTDADGTNVLATSINCEDANRFYCILF
ncbi:MAG: type II secretion system protein [Patescibacteria group bacterium]